MSTPTPAGASSPLRAAGLVLIGLAVVFGALGVLTPAEESAAPAPVPGDPTPDSSATTVLPSPATPTTAASSTTVPPTTTPVPTTTPPATTTVPSATPVPTTPAAPAAEPTDPRATVDVVVLNNSTISGLAAQAAADVQQQGWTVAEVGNFTGLVPTTTVYYRPGEADAARALADDLGAAVEPRVDGLPTTAPGLVLVVTVDYAG